MSSGLRYQRRLKRWERPARQLAHLLGPTPRRGGPPRIEVKLGGHASIAPGGYFVRNHGACFPASFVGTACAPQGSQTARSWANTTRRGSSCARRSIHAGVSGTTASWWSRPACQASTSAP